MKVYEIDSELKAEVLVKSNDLIHEEFGHTTNRQGLAHSCYVPVETGHKLTLNCYLKGKFQKAQFDFIVDGVLRNVRQYTFGKEKMSYKKEEFGTGIEKEVRRVHQSVMRIGLLPDDIRKVYDKYAVDSVGCVELRISLKRNDDPETYVPDIPLFENVHHWRDVYGFDERKNEKPIAHSTIIPPVQEIRFIPIEAEGVMAPTQSGRAKRYARGERPGLFPWATFKFYYRPAKMIQEAGLTLDRHDQSYAIETPKTDAAIAIALHKAAPQKNKKQLSVYVADSDLEDDDDDASEQEELADQLPATDTARTPTMSGSVGPDGWGLLSTPDTLSPDPILPLPMGALPPNPFASHAAKISRKRTGFMAVLPGSEQTKRAKVELEEPLSYVATVKKQKARLEMQQRQLEEMQAKREKLQLDIEEKRMKKRLAEETKALARAESELADLEQPAHASEYESDHQPSKEE